MQLHCWPARLYKPNADTSSRYVHVEIMLRKAQLQRRRICYFSIGKDTSQWISGDAYILCCEWADGGGAIGS